MPDLGRVDFRAGTLTGTGGFTSLGGTPTITEADPPVGVFAAEWNTDASTYGLLEVPASPNIYCYIYVIVDTAPAANVTLLQIRNSGVAVGEIILSSALKLLLRDGASGAILPQSDTLTAGTLYRVGVVYNAGTGANGVLEGWFGEAHQPMMMYANSTSETATADVDEILAGAITINAFDGRIGYLAADSRLMPGSWLDIHDMVVGPLGLMRVSDTASQVSDLAPAYDRAAIGEARHETFQPMSFIALANFGGGAGQYRLISQDKYLSGIGDGRFSGLYFPPRKALAEADGGTTSWFFERSNLLYGFTASNIQQIGTATTVSYAAAPIQQPVVGLIGNSFWVDDDANIKKFDGTTVTDVTPGSYIPMHVAAYGTGLWCLAKQTVPAGATLTNEKTFESPEGGNTRIQVDMALSGGTRLRGRSAGKWLVLVIVGIAGDTNPRTLVPNESGWELVPGATISFSGATDGLHGWVYQRELTNPYERNWTFDVSDNIEWYAAAAELDGMAFDRNLPDGIARASGTGTSITTGGTGTLDQTDEYAFAFLADNNTAEDLAASTGTWTEMGDGYVDTTAGREMRIFRNKLSATGTINITDTIASADWIAGIATFKGNALPASIEQFAVLYSADGGNTWTPAPSTPPVAALTFGEVRASLALGGRLYFTTEQGLFAMIGDVSETIDGVRVVVVAVTQQDSWEASPYGLGIDPRSGSPQPIVPDNHGKWVGAFEGLLYYPVGSTVRRYTPGNDQGTAFWPGEDWATVVDDVQALISNEAGIWFSAAGYLWLFNGRGFFPMASEPTDGDFDYLYNYNGRIYFKDDPAGYLNLPFPTIRPDISMALGDLTQDDFDTGYLITSSLDFEKAADPKIIRLFESQVSFTDQASTSGTITFHYRNGCDTDDDPGLVGGGDLSGSWTLIGEHAFADGGYKRFTFTTPLQCYRIYVRATLTPGSTGIPRLHYFTVWGASILPAVDAIVGQFRLANGMVDKENSVIFDDPAQVSKTLRVLRDMRKRNEPSTTTPLYHTLYLRDGSDGGREVTALFTKIESGEVYRGEDGLGYEAIVVCGFEELPK